MSWNKSKRYADMYDKRMGKTRLVVHKLHFECWQWNVSGTYAKASGTEKSKDMAMQRAFDVAELVAERVDANKCWGCNDMPFCNAGGDEDVYKDTCQAEREWLK